MLNNNIVSFVLLEFLWLIYLSFQVKKIVQGQFGLFQAMYKPLLEEYAAKGLLQFSSVDGNQAIISQVYLEPL